MNYALLIFVNLLFERKQTCQLTLVNGPARIKNVQPTRRLDMFDRHLVRVQNNTRRYTYPKHIFVVLVYV